MFESLGMAALIFICRLTDVSMGTMRMLYTVRGRKYLAGSIGVVEVSIFLWAISSVMKSVGNWPQFFAYSLGFGVGTILGITIEEKLAPGNLWVTIVSGKMARKVAEKLRGIGFGVTESAGRGKDGRVTMLTSIIRRRDFPMLLEVVQDVDPEAFVTSDYTHTVNRGYLHRIKRK